jgi:hypothetical protein
MSHVKYEVELDEVAVPASPEKEISSSVQHVRKGVAFEPSCTLWRSIRF